MTRLAIQSGFQRRNCWVLMCNMFVLLITADVANPPQKKTFCHFRKKSQHNNKKSAAILQRVLMCAGARENWTQIFRKLQMWSFSLKTCQLKKKKHAVKMTNVFQLCYFDHSCTRWVKSMLMNLFLIFLKHLIGNVPCFKASQDIVALSEQHYPIFFLSSPAFLVHF